MINKVCYLSTMYILNFFITPTFFFSENRPEIIISFTSVHILYKYKLFVVFTAGYCDLNWFKKGHHYVKILGTTDLYYLFFILAFKIIM